MGIVYFFRPACLNGFNRFMIGCSGSEDPSVIEKKCSRKYGKNTTVYCLFGNIPNFVQMEREVIKVFDNQFERVSERLYTGDFSKMLSVFCKEICNRLKDDRLEDIARKELESFYDKFDGIDLKNSRFIPNCVCRDFKTRINKAFVRAGLKYQLSSSMKSSDVSDFIRFQKPPLEFTAVLD